jgi:hypothetical protein
MQRPDFSHLRRCGELCAFLPGVPDILGLGERGSSTGLGGDSSTGLSFLVKDDPRRSGGGPSDGMSFLEDDVETCGGESMVTLGLMVTMRGCVLSNGSIL